MTFVRIGQFNALPGTADALRRIYETEAIPVIRQAAGNVSALLLRQHQSPESFMAITIWKTQDDAEAYDRSGQAMEIVAKIKFAFAGPPTLGTYEAYGILKAA